MDDLRFTRPRIESRGKPSARSWRRRRRGSGPGHALRAGAGQHVAGAALGDEERLAVGEVALGVLDPAAGQGDEQAGGREQRDRGASSVRVMRAGMVSGGRVEGAPSSPWAAAMTPRRDLLPAVAARRPRRKRRPDVRAQRLRRLQPARPGARRSPAPRRRRPGRRATAAPAAGSAGGERRGDLGEARVRGADAAGRRTPPPRRRPSRRPRGTCSARPGPRRRAGAGRARRARGGRPR